MRSFPRSFRTGLVMIALAAISSCDAGTADPDSNTAAAASDPAPGNGSITISADQARALALRWAVAETAREAPIATLPATIAPPANARVAVTALYPGVIKRIFVVEGDHVRAGQTLAIVVSRDVLSRGADLSRAQARLGVAQSNAARLGQLSREGIIAGARADEARAMLREAEADVSEQRRLLGMAGASSRSGTYTLSAPISGRISTMVARTGEQVDPARAPFVIDATDRYEIEAQLPQRLVRQVRPGMIVRIGDTVTGTVTSVGATLDPGTRSAMLKASIPAAPGVVSGSAVEVQLYGPAPEGAVLVPDSAVTSLGGKDVVFVRSGAGVKARPISCGASLNGRTIVLNGLHDGERVVVEGTSALKARALAQ